MTSPPFPPDDALARVDDYVSGHMADAEAAAYEDELFAAAATGDEADGAFLDGIARMSVLMASVGGFAQSSTRAQVDELIAAGWRVHVADFGAGGAVSLPPWAAGTQIVVSRLGVDLRGYDSVDVEVETAAGAAVKTFRDVGCDPADGALYAICQEPLARLAFTRGRTISRVIGTRGGRRETVAVFDLSPLPR